LKRPHSPIIVVFVGSLIYLFWNWPHTMLLLLGVFYVGSGIVVRIGGIIRRMLRRAEAA
jgi:CDP-diacylglycerol--serine O-phosphatidyltransferase